MKWNRGVTHWLLSLLLVGGMAALFILPVVLTATPSPDRKTDLPQPGPGADAPPPGLDAYEPEVRELIETTYLGREKEFPDPGEPAVVLRKYLEQDTHKYLEWDSEQIPALELEIVEWEALALSAPQSRHAHAGLAYLYTMKARITQDTGWVRKAAEHYSQAAEIGLTHGRIRYVWELSDLLVELDDKAGLDEIFGRILASPQDQDRGYYHDALVAYAHGLARLKDYDRAWGYFEEALDLNSDRPENSIGAINFYAHHLLDQEQAQRALEILDRLTPEMRQRSLASIFLRREAVKKAGLDLTSALQEVEAIKQRMSGTEGMRFIPESEFLSQYEFIPISRLGPLVLGDVRSIAPKIDLPPESPDHSLSSLLLSFDVSTAEAQPWQHTGSDDCRTHDSTPVECYYDPDTEEFLCALAPGVNLAEIEYNECGGNCRNAGWAAVDAVGWTVRDRSRQNVCGGDNICSNPSAGLSYDGGCGWHNRPVCTNLPCSDAGPPLDPQNGIDYCTSSKWYCCAIHGGTGVGASHYQFNNRHVDTTTLLNLGYMDAAYRVINGYVPDMTTKGYLGYYWTAPGVSGCTFQCGVPDCTSGWNNKHASHSGPMEWRACPWYSPAQPGCMYQPLDPSRWSSGNVCNGGNCFANRRSRSAIFATKADLTIWKARINHADNNMDSWVQVEGLAKKLATFKWPDGTAGLAAIGSDDAGWYRLFNGTSWGGWMSLGGIVRDLAAIAYRKNNANQADLFGVGVDNCNIYINHYNGSTWGGWSPTPWGACGDQITAALMPDGKGWAALRATGAGNSAAVRYFDGANWAGSWTPNLGGIVNADMALTTYPNPNPPNGIKATLWAVGQDNCGVHFRNWDSRETTPPTPPTHPARWTPWTPWVSCFKGVSSFSAGSSSAYLLLIGTNNNYLYTERFTGSAWESIVQRGTQTWSAAAGVDVE